MLSQHIRTIPTIELIHLIGEESANNNQELVNRYTYELATRMYIPNNNLGVTFEELLIKLGYQDESKVGQNKKLILK